MLVGSCIVEAMTQWGVAERTAAVTEQSQHVYWSDTPQKEYQGSTTRLEGGPTADRLVSQLTAGNAKLLPAAD
jgi:hypothetical protein